MRPEFDPELEAQIDRLLKGQPDLAAPRGLVARAMKALARPTPTPWHARPWAEWPAGWRAGFLVLTCGALAAAFLGWHAAAPGLAGVVLPRLTHWAAAAGCVWSTLGALAGAAALVARHFGNGFVPACLLVGAIAYAACIGFGTLIIRFAFAPAGKLRL
jgi:hypothetical protein